MLKSMTAYCRLEWESPAGALVIELHSVNRKGLELSFSLPEGWLCLELDLRGWLAARIARGHVTARLSLKGGRSLQADVGRLAELKREWEALATQLGYEAERAISLPFLCERLEPRPSLSGGEEGLLRASLQEGIARALDSLMEMKRREGTALARDIAERLRLIAAAADEIAAGWSEEQRRMREKLRKRFEEYMSPTSSPPDERLERELALLVEKADIVEEVVRLRSHCEQCAHLLGREERSVGRHFDFLAQEMMREFSTICAKASGGRLLTAALAGKVEVERLREQVQNVE